MAAAGCQLHADLTALAVMWFARVLVNLHKFWDLVEPGRPLLPPSSARRRGADRLSGLQLVDRPAGEGPRHSGVLLHAAADLGLGAVAGEEDAAAGGPRAVQPAVRGGVVPPSTAATRRSSAIRSSTRSAASRSTSSSSQQHRGRPGPLVAILPGSRTQEVTHNLRWFLKAAALVRAAVPDVRFAVAAFKPHQAEIARRQVAAARPADRGPRRQDARADAAGRLLHGRLRLGLAGTALPHHADGDSRTGSAGWPTSCRASSAR